MSNAGARSIINTAVSERRIREDAGRGTSKHVQRPRSWQWLKQSLQRRHDECC